MESIFGSRGATMICIRLKLNKTGGFFMRYLLINNKKIFDENTK